MIGWTFGAELEFADVSRRTALPQGCSWNNQEMTLVNSNGVANDPLGELWPYGGEVNTRPTNDAADQVSVCMEVVEALAGTATINYRCDFQVHIGVPGLADDLAAVKRVARYIQENYEDVTTLVDPIARPRANEWSAADYVLAKGDYRRKKRLHHTQLPAGTFEKQQASTTVEEFYRAEFRVPPPPRVWVNLRQLWRETQTVEFRHFFSTANEQEIESCLWWCELFLDAALNEGPPARALLRARMAFPTARQFEPHLERGYIETNFAHHSRSQVRKTLERKGLLSV